VCARRATVTADRAAVDELRDRVRAPDAAALTVCTWRTAGRVWADSASRITRIETSPSA